LNDPSRFTAPPNVNVPEIASTSASKVANNMTTNLIIGGIVSGLILIFLVGLSLFLVRMYKIKKKILKQLQLLD
jgi:hypothetical protein